jgi:hypothetical protein
MPPLRRVTALSLTALALLAAACGSDADEDPGARESQNEAPLQEDATNDPAEPQTPAPEESPRGEGEGD